MLALSFGALIVLAVGSVLTVSVGANYRNTVDLLSAQSGLLVDAMEEQLRGHMRNAQSAVQGIRTIYAEGGFEIDQAGTMNAALSGALASVPEATALFIFTEDFKQRGVFRQIPTDGGPETIEVVEVEVDRSPETVKILTDRFNSDRLAWGSFVANQYGLFANVSAPLVRDGVHKGLVVAAVNLTSLSGFTRDLSRRFGTTAFILDGDKVVAHPSLANPLPGDRSARPLMPLATFSDPVLAAYANPKAVERLDEIRLPNLVVSDVTVDGEQRQGSYVTMTRKIEGYSDQPWVIGAYFERDQLDQELRRAAISALIGLGALVAAVIAAILLGRRMSRPIKAIAGQARRVAAFELDDVTPLPRSRVRELDDQASAFNAMLVGLRAFSTYIPRSLVAKLVRGGEAGVAEPREALVTVMFTDIANFTSLSERMGAADTTRYLNQHFQILCEAIDAEGGTVDKFLGDGMMAFFGAPDHLEDHAAAAVRAALRIRQDLAADAKLAASEGRPVFKLRIGIHTGLVTVGNIGGPDRVNYTIIGDTVNVSQRLQGLAKELAPDQQTAIVISAVTASLVNGGFETEAAGLHSLRGRGEAMEVYLVGEENGLQPLARQPMSAA